MLWKIPFALGYSFLVLFPAVRMNMFRFFMYVFLSPKTRNTLCPELLGYCPCKNVNEYGLKKVILTFLIISVSGYHLDLKSIF